MQKRNGELHLISLQHPRLFLIVARFLVLVCLPDQILILWHVDHELQDIIDHTSSRKFINQTLNELSLSIRT